jgi:hypothetical protein
MVRGTSEGIKSRDAAEAHKTRHIGELDAKQRTVSDGLSELLEHMSDSRGGVQVLEAEVSSLANRIAREVDTDGATHT